VPCKWMETGLRAVEITHPMWVFNSAAPKNSAPSCLQLHLVMGKKTRSTPRIFGTLSSSSTLVFNFTQ